MNPKSNDKERQQIERKLGKFDDVKHLLADQDVTNLFGVDGQPPPSPAPPNRSLTTSSHEFKKPNACLQNHPSKSSHHHHHHRFSSQRYMLNLRQMYALPGLLRDELHFLEFSLKESTQSKFSAKEILCSQHYPKPFYFR